jgi:hypothetical protein
MSDVPAAGSWLAALRLAGSADRSGQALRLAGLADRSGQAPRLAAAALSGTVTALAILIRPNLAPLAVIVAALAVGPGSAGRVRRLIAWAAPVLAGAVLLGSIQYVRYGSVLASGYGSLFDLFSLANVVPNLERYPRWITGTQTIAIWLWLAAPIWIVRRSTNRALPAGAWALTLVVWASYLSYAAFGEHEWTYTRFLLPALPLMLFFCAALALAFVRWLPPGARAAAAIVLLGTLAMSTLAAARSHGVFSVRQQEQRYPDVGAFVRTKLPAATFVLAVQHSGSIRYYANRPTLRWDLLDPARLDDAVGMLRSGGYIPVLVVDAAEEIEFRERFGRAGQQAVSRLSQLARYGSTGIYGFD